MKSPVFSIITVTWNAEKVLEKTIESIVGQTAFDHIEYIVVDGASKDGTKAIIEKYSDKISKWVSEPDKGLYDAMNKGLKMATGDYVWFMNAGDEIFAADVVENMLKCQPDADIYYGETEEMSEAGDYIGMRRLQAPENLQFKSFKRGMLVCHQSIIIKRSLVGEYNLKYRISADQDWVISALHKAKSIVNTRLIISKFAKGGTSGQNIKKALIERFEIQSKHYGLFSTILNHIPIAIKFFWFLARNRRF